MSLAVEKLDGSMAKLTITVPAEEFTKAITSAYNKQKSKFSVPGFRKGKVPQAFIEKMYGAAIFYEDAANQLINEYYPKELENCEEEITSNPEIDVTQIEKGKPFIFTAEVATKPEVELGEYKGIEVPKYSNRVTQKEIDAKLEEEQLKNARTITVEGRPVQDKDEVVLDFEGFVDGEAFEGGKGENYPLTIGSGSFIPGFEEQLIGAEPEKEVEVKVTFPEDYHAEDLKGKEAVFKCTVHEIKAKELPELDDEFASEVSEFDTLDELKADIKAKIKEQKVNDGKRAQEDAAVDAIIESAKMDLPEAMVDTQARQMLDEFAQRMQQQGLTLDQYMQFTGMTADKMMDELRPQAEKRIKTRLVLEAIAKAENIEITDEKLDEEIAKMAEAYQMEADKVSTFTDMGDGQCMPNQAYRLIGIVRGRHQASLRLHIEKLLRNLRLTNNDAAHADFQRTPNHIRLVSADHNAVGIGKEQVLPAGGQCDHHLARNLVPQLPAGIENLSLDDGEQIVYRHAGNHRVADRAHVIVGHVPSGEHAIQRPILVGHWQHRNPVCLHGLPGPADCGSGGECGRRVVVQVPYLCTHIANEARRLKTEALQNGMGLIADLAQAGCLILPLPQSILQGGIGHGGND